MAVAQEPMPVTQAGQAHGAQSAEGQPAKVAALVPVAEGDGQDFLGEPTVQLAQLRLVVHVFQVIINQCHGPELLGHHIARNIHGQLRVGIGVLLLAQATPH